MYSQPFHSTFCKVLNLDTEGFPTPSCAVPMRDCDVGKVRIDDLHDLTVVVGELLKLEIKVVSSPDELRFRRIAFGGCEFLAEASFDDKTAAVMLRSGFAEQFVETDEDRTETLQLNCGIVHIRAKRLLLSVRRIFQPFYPI